MNEAKVGGLENIITDCYVVIEWKVEFIEKLVAIPDEIRPDQ
jgi:hypothetical protein